MKLLLWLVIDACFRVFPATPGSSALLQAAHLVLVVALWRAPVAPSAKLHAP